MSKILNLYQDNIDKSWYDSSNIIYSECDDVLNGLKILKIVFKNGRTYKYFDVDVNDYLLFRENASQGKAFSKYILKYKCERVEDSDVNSLMDELNKEITYSDNSVSGGTCSYFVEINECKNDCDVYCEGNLIDKFKLNETPKTLISNLLKTLKVEYKIIENE